MVAVGSFGSGTGNNRRSSGNNNKPGSSGPGASMSVKNSKQKHAMSGSTNKSFLLARGWTSRLALPSILPTLRADEMEKDLRHMQVYGNAVQSYQQQFYIQTNRVGELGENGAPTVPSHTGVRAPNNSASLSLPVRIDPEEEKRLFNLRKKIAAAEVLREQLEQEWVANQAHYVYVAAKLRDAQQKRKETIAFLQQAVKSKAAVTAQARLRLQMTRDVSNALQYRLARVQSVGVAMRTIPEMSEKQAESETQTQNIPKPVNAMEVDAAPTDPGASSTVASSTVASSTVEDFLTELWTTAEDEYKRVCMQMMGGNEKISKKKNSNKSLINWPGTTLPTTPSEVPLRVSVLSKIPDKTVAYGPDPLNMIWMPTNLSDKYNTTESKTTTPKVEDEENENLLLDDENPDDEALKQRVSQLEKELAMERRLNTEWSFKIAASRKVNDEWVAMMSLVRQETEALLHRHNILLESDMALTASEEIHEQEMQDKAEAEAQAAEHKDQTDETAGDEGKSTATGSDAGGKRKRSPDESNTMGASGVPSNSGALAGASGASDKQSAISEKVQDADIGHDEAANDGDDEGSGGVDEDDKDEWAAVTTTAEARTALAESTQAGALKTTTSVSVEAPNEEGEEKNGNTSQNKRPSEPESQEDETEAKRRKLE